MDIAEVCDLVFFVDGKMPVSDGVARVDCVVHEALVVADVGGILCGASPPNDPANGQGELLWRGLSILHGLEYRDPRVARLCESSGLLTCQ